MIHRPKTAEKLFFLFSGSVISIPFALLVNTLVSYFLSINFNYYFAALMAIVIIGPLLEEFAKAYPLFYRHGETQKSLTTLGLLVGLGFGIVEFLVYIFLYQVPLIARLPLIIFHATNTTIVAYGIGSRQAILFYLLAVVLHALNNLGSLIGGYGLILNGAAIFLSYTLASFFHFRAQEKTIKFD